MILGRNAGLWGALVQSAINLVALAAVVVTGQGLSGAEVALFAGANVLGAAAVALLANSSDPTTVPTFAPTLSERRGTPATPGDTVALYTGPDRRNGGSEG